MNETQKYELFISYRRDGGVDYARMIYLELKGRGYNTFFDYNSLRDGKFNEGIFRAIEECRYFILVLSTGALDRCNDKDDWVRHEIEYALSMGKGIIPVCPAGNMRGFPAKMPESLEPIRTLQISILQMDDLFEKSFDKIVEDRFDAEFRKGRAPVAAREGVTSGIFRRIGIGVIAAIITASGIIGISNICSRKAETDEPQQSNQATEEMLSWVAEEKKAADAAKEKAQQEAIAAKNEKIRLEAEVLAKEKAAAELRRTQEEKIRLEAEAKAKEKADAELRAAQQEKMRLEAEMKAKEDAESVMHAALEAKIRAEAESKAVRSSVTASVQNETLKRLEREEADVRSRLSAIDRQIEALEKEDLLPKPISVSRLDTGFDLPDFGNSSRIDTAKRNKQELSSRLAQLQEKKARVEAIEKAYHEFVVNRATTVELDKAKAELEALAERIVSRRFQVDAVKDQLPAEDVLRAKQLDELALAEHGSLLDALEKARAADKAYGNLLDKVIEQKINQIMDAVDTLPENFKWNSVKDHLSKLLSIDPDNERVQRAYKEAVGRVNPSMTVTAEMNGRVIDDVRFFADSEPVPTPFHHVFEPSSHLCFLDAVYVKDGVHYAARRYGSSHSWIGETNIILKLKETPAAGTPIRLKLGRQSQSIRNRSGQPRCEKLETYIDFVWCPPGTDMVKFIDPDTDEKKSAIRSIEIGFWISRYELTGRQYHAIIDEDKKRQSPWDNVKQPHNDIPVQVNYDDFTIACYDSSRIRVEIDGLKRNVSDNAVFSLPNVGQWIHATQFGGFDVSEEVFSDYAWWMGNAGTNVVFKGGMKKPNNLGIYDVFGNVPEWAEGFAKVWLGLEEAIPHQFAESILGGGCNDDFDSATDIFLESHNARDRAGIRLIARSRFEHESSLVDWVTACDLLDSGDEKERKSGMDLLAKLATESDDSVLRDEAGRDYVLRGGDPKDIRIALTPSVRLLLVERTSKAEDLSKFVMEDEDASVREYAFRKLKKVGTPSQIVVLRYLVDVKDSAEAERVLFEYFVMKEGRQMVPREGIEEEVFNNLALNAKNRDVRANALCAVNDQQVLKDVALTDNDSYVIFSAIKRLTDRAILTEIRGKTKKKAVKTAARDRLKELSD